MRALDISIEGVVNGFKTTATSLGTGGETDLQRIIIMNATTGINIGTNVEHTKVYLSCLVGPDVTTRLTDNGTNTFVETGARLLLIQEQLPTLYGMKQSQITRQPEPSGNVLANY